MNANDLKLEIVRAEGFAEGFSTGFRACAKKWAEEETAKEKKNSEITESQNTNN